MSQSLDLEALRQAVATAPVLRRAPRLRDAILATLQRIPELERQVANLEADLHSQDADYWRQRAERVDAEARLDPGRKSCPIHGALAAAPGVENTAPCGIDPAQADEIDRELGIGPYTPAEEPK